MKSEHCDCRRSTIRAIIIKKAPLYKKAPPLFVPDLEQGGGFLIKSAGGRNFFQDSVSFCCENPFWNVVFANEIVMLQIQIHQNFRLRRAVRNTLSVVLYWCVTCIPIYLYKVLFAPTFVKIVSRLNSYNFVLRIAVARSYTRKNIASCGWAVPILFCECQRRVSTLVKHWEPYLKWQRRVPIPAKIII